jgi:chromosome partitioning protein
MKTISIINLKGGVAKTITSVSLAHILATEHNKKVLLIDNDKQGNASKIYNCYDSYDKNTIARAMTERNLDPNEIIKHTTYENLDIVSANMNLLTANISVMMDASRQQQTRFKKAFENLDYDYCIIDNAPDINISIINAFTMSDEVIVPIKIDQFAFDGLNILKEQIKDNQADFNPGLLFRGCLITQFTNTDVCSQGEELLREMYPVFKTKIRRTASKIDESTFAKTPIVEYSRRCSASKDYLALVNEYLK